MDPHLNNYVLQRAGAIFRDVNLPPKIQEAFDLWPKVRRLIVTDHTEIVGGHYYTLRTNRQEGAVHSSVKAVGKAIKIRGNWYAHLKILNSEYFEVAENSNTDSYISMHELAGRLYHTCADTQRFLKLTKYMHPAQFYCVVSGEHYDLEFFNAFRELQL